MALVDRHVAPPDRALALGLDRLLDQLFEQDPALGVGRQIADAHAVAARRRQFDAGDRGPKESVGDLYQDSGAVPSVRIGPLGAAMLEILERLECLLDDGMARLTPKLRHERDAARIVLVLGVVEATGPGWSETLDH